MEIDVRREADVSALIQLAVSRFGKIDVAINNAGVETPLGPVQDATVHDFDRVIGTNLLGVWLCLKYELRHMLAHGGGQKLYDMVWSEPMTSMAKNFGISDVPLAKRRTTGETAQPSWPGGRYARFGSFGTAFNRKSAPSASLASTAWRPPAARDRSRIRSSGTRESCGAACMT